MITLEQIVNAQKTNIDALSRVTGRAFEGIEKLIQLNVSTAKSALVEVAQNAKLAVSVKDLQELIALHTSLLQPTAEKAKSYGRSVYEIAASTTGETSRVAEAQATEVRTKFMAMIDTALKNAPAGTENSVALFKSALAASNNAIETAKKAGRQAAEMGEANLKAMSATAVGAYKAKKA